jgi:putative membrane protein
MIWKTGCTFHLEEIMKRLVKDAIYGGLGGLVGTFVIGRVMSFGGKFQPEADKKLQQKLTGGDPTEKLATRIAEEGFGVELSDEAKATAGKAIHWGYGVFWGGVYGVFRRRFRNISRAFGLPFGLSLATFGDALMLPAMGLSEWPQKYPLSTHLLAGISHYAYAASAEGVCEAMDAVDRRFMRHPGKTNPELRRVS